MHQDRARRPPAIDRQRGPVMKDAASEARNITAAGASSGLEARPRGMLLVTAFTCASVRGLAVLPAAKPGSTALQRMPYSASSTAKPLVSRSSAVLEME